MFARLSTFVVFCPDYYTLCALVENLQLPYREFIENPQARESKERKLENGVVFGDEVTRLEFVYYFFHLECFFLTRAIECKNAMLGRKNLV